MVIFGRLPRDDLGEIPRRTKPGTRPEFQAEDLDRFTDEPSVKSEN